jgi:hypothetical protein
MSTLESIDRIAPRSILRHRPIGEDSSSTKKVVELFSATQPTIPRASRPTIVNNVEVMSVEEQQDKRKKDKVNSKRKCIDAETTKLMEVLNHKLTIIKSKKKGYQTHPLFYLGAGMAAAVLLWTVVSVVCSWSTLTLDDIRYGRPRTFQEDAWVGHNEQTGVPSHFIAVNLNRRIEIIELPGGDPTHAKVYVGPQLYGANDDLVPVTLKFIDVNKNHKPDMLVSFQGTHFVFINDQGGFRPMSSSEHDKIEQFLQH